MRIPPPVDAETERRYHQPRTGIQDLTRNLPFRPFAALMTYGHGIMRRRVVNDRCAEVVSSVFRWDDGELIICNRAASFFAGGRHTSVTPLAS
jgi:hypothetical protein